MLTKRNRECNSFQNRVEKDRFRKVLHICMYTLTYICVGNFGTVRGKQLTEASLPVRPENGLERPITSSSSGYERKSGKRQHRGTPIQPSEEIKPGKHVMINETHEYKNRTKEMNSTRSKDAKSLGINNDTITAETSPSRTVETITFSKK
ncbi:hypothetical protein KQX54_000611 [Cotesia glomerata]|uniref:Uncharacterized protein n=1 Tax=Cotesia glomerata TaxID=32391 RepID=A0AAV7IUQ5_COTGL|nr:hypothetical protein KQX54_000611 [Cotesia glomerata]